MATAPTPSGIGALIAGGFAAVVASVCCVGPLILLALGVSGAWIANLTALEPYRPVFVVAALMFLALAFHRLYLAPAACATGTRCASASAGRRRRLIFWLVAVPVVALLAFPWYASLFY